MGRIGTATDCSTQACGQSHWLLCTAPAVGSTRAILLTRSLVCCSCARYIVLSATMSSDVDSILRGDTSYSKAVAAARREGSSTPAPVAVFYSVTNTMRGLQGLQLASFLLFLAMQKVPTHGVAATALGSLGCTDYIRVPCCHVRDSITCSWLSGLVHRHVRGHVSVPVP